MIFALNKSDLLTKEQKQQWELDLPNSLCISAKKGDIEAWLGQCGAEMYAAQIFNAREGHDKKAIFGCVTNAFSWAFLKLEDKNLYIDPNYIPLTYANPNLVLSVLQHLLNESMT